MSGTCIVCGGACMGAELTPLLDARLAWLWEQLARAADRRGDPDLDTGTLSIRAPAAAAARAAAMGLVGDRPLKQGQSRTLDLANLAERLRVRGAKLTPGAVAAHASGRRLAERAAALKSRRIRQEALGRMFENATQALLMLGDSSQVWEAVRKSGWLARVIAASNPEGLLRAALGVIAALPHAGQRIDRRRLAAEVTGDPHALDHGSSLAGLVAGILSAAGKIDSRLRPGAAWASVGVDCDDIVGGLTTVGMLPVGWVVPQGALTTLPPRELKTCNWPAPPARAGWVFVTENPSIASAAADLAATGVIVHLLCMSGTPSAIEVAAMSRLAQLGWRVAVRADFDAAGVAHVNAVRSAIADAVAWRMSVDDYASALPGDVLGLPILGNIPDACWDTGLSRAMRERGVPIYEEAFLSLLMTDLRNGSPPASDIAGMPAP